MNPEALAALHARCFTTPRPFTAAEIAGLLDSPHVFLCTRPDGFALGRALAGEAELLTIAVDPARRRQGLGRALLGDFDTGARARAATEAFLEVADGNAAARALYAAAGWQPAGRRRGYYRDPDGSRDDALLLRKALAPA